MPGRQETTRWETGNTYLRYILGRQETTRWEAEGTHTYSTCREDKGQPGGKLRERIPTVHAGETRDNQVGNGGNTYLQYIPGRQETTKWEAEGTHTYSTCREATGQPGGKLRERIPTVHAVKTRDNQVGN